MENITTEDSTSQEKSSRNETGSKSFSRKKSNTEEFIEKANKIHGDGKYDYSKVAYTGCMQKVIIICKQHGEFLQDPNSHLSGKGCSRCAKTLTGIKRRITTQEFIRQANAVHGDGTYDYSLSVYVKTSQKVKIFCKQHGIFEQTPNNHLSKAQTCPTCNTERRAQREVDSKSAKQYLFLSRLTKEQKDFYDLSQAVFVTSKTKVKVICPIHGEFFIAPDHLIRGKNCKKCSNEFIGDLSRKSKEQFISEALSVHKDKNYCYDFVEYVNTNTRVDIICPKHGKFKKSPTNLLKGQGCPKCMNERFKLGLSAYFYILQCGNLVKVGITNRTVKRRMQDIRKSSGIPFDCKFFIFFEDGLHCKELEKEILKMLRSKYKNIDRVFDGSTETFQDVTVDEVIRSIGSVLVNIN